MALAADERATGAEYTGPWDARQVTYLDRLTAEAGYQPGEWEQARLEEARGRVQARAELSCPACGCRHGQPCTAYPRCDAERTGEGTWRYRCGCATRTGPTPPSSSPPGTAETTAPDDLPGDLEDLYGALEDLLIAVDPTTSAGAHLPPELDEAIEDTATAFRSLYDGQRGDQPPMQLLTAAWDLHTAALPHETSWTPQLRDAFTALAKCTETEGQ